MFNRSDTSILDLKIPFNSGVCKCIDILLPIKQYIVRASGTTNSIAYDRKILFLFSASKCTIAHTHIVFADQLSFCEYSIGPSGSLNRDMVKCIYVPFIKNFVGINFDTENELLLFSGGSTSTGLWILNLGTFSVSGFHDDNIELLSSDSKYVWFVYPEVEYSGSQVYRKVFRIYRIDAKDLLMLRNQKQPELFWRDCMESETRRAFSHYDNNDIAIFPPVSFFSISDISNSFFIRTQKASKLVINNKIIRRGVAILHLNACFHEDTIIFWKVCSELWDNEDPEHENYLVIFPPIPMEYVFSKKLFNLKHLPDPLITTFKKNLSYVFFIPEERRVILGDPVSYDFPWGEYLWSNYLVDTTHSSMMFIKPYGIRIYPVWNVLRGVPYTIKDMKKANKQDPQINALLRAKHPYRFPKFDKWGGRCI